MADLQTVIFFSLIGGLFSLIGGVILLSRKKLADATAKYATPFAAGALLAAVFLDLLADGVEQAEAETVLLSALIGLLAFFFMERFLHWFHHHHEHEDGSDPSKSLVIIGDIFHNFLDGVAIAAAFLVSVPTGIVTTIAVAAHEIPQEIGDFGLLLHKGMRRRNVLLVNILSALATTVAAIITFTLGSAQVLPVGVLLGLSAGFLLYIAASDIIPEIHQRTAKGKFLDWQPVMLLLGVILVGVVIEIAHGYIDVDHNHDAESSQINAEHINDGESEDAHHEDGHGHE